MLKLGHRLGQKLGKKKSSNRKKIIVRCNRSHTVVYREEGESDDDMRISPVYDCYDYYLVDLEGGSDNSILEPYCEPLFDNIRCPGSFILLGSSMYSIPYISYCEYENIPATLWYPNNGEMVNRLSQVFVTTFDVSHNPKKWTPSCGVPTLFRCAALGGEIYGLEAGNINNPVRFNPSDKCWTPCGLPPPPEIQQSGVNGRLVADPINERILVHLYGGTLNQPFLYAWRPKITDENENNKAWERLYFFNTKLWFGGTILVNFDNKSLLFFFFNRDEDLFSVWSVDDCNFLETRWCNKVPKLKFRSVEAHSMCYLGKNQLCLALSFRPVIHNDIPVTFLILEINHLSKSGIEGKGEQPAIESKGKEPINDASSDSIITFTYVSSKSFKALDTRYVVDITPLEEVYCDDWIHGRKSKQMTLCS